MSLQGLGIAGATVNPTSTVDDETKRASVTNTTTASDGLPGTSSIQTTPNINESPNPTAIPVPVHIPDDFDPSIGAKPSSPFYRHATPSYSLEHLTWESRRANRDPSHLKDPEAQITQVRSSSVDGEKSQLSKLWRKKKQPWELLQGLSKRKRIAAKTVIAVLTVGGMVGIAIGITSAVGGGVWQYNKQQGTVRGNIKPL